MIKRRTIKRFQRTFAVLGLLVVLSSFIVVPVQGAELETTGVFRNFCYALGEGSESIMYATNIEIPYVNRGITGINVIPEDNNLVCCPQITVGTGSKSFTNNVDIYFSFYPYSTQDVLYSVGLPYSASSWNGYYKNTTGRYGQLTSVQLSKFTPVTDNYYSSGVSLIASYVGSEGLPITDLRLGTAVLDGTTFVPTRNGWHGSSYAEDIRCYYYITSLRVITTDSSVESEAIADVANQIGAMSDLLASKLGDIAYLVQLIYENTNDMEQTLNICKDYFASMLEALEHIDGTVTDIYTLLNTQFAMLIASINTANSDITSAIEQQTEDMKEYFDNVFGSAVNDQLTGESDNIQSGMDNVDNAEQGYISTAADRFDGIVGSFTGFEGSVASGVSLVSTLFERVWGSFGQYIIVYTFPLSLGLVLLLIGRVSRASSRSSRSSGKSKGGDSE